MAKCDEYKNGYDKWDRIYDDAWYREFGGEIGAWATGIGGAVVGAGAAMCWFGVAAGEPVTFGGSTAGAPACLGLTGVSIGLLGKSVDQSLGEEPEEKERIAAEENREKWSLAYKACLRGEEAPDIGDLPAPPGEDDDTGGDNTPIEDNQEEWKFTEDDLEDLEEERQECECDEPADETSAGADTSSVGTDTVVFPPMEFDFSNDDVDPDGGADDEQPWEFDEDDLGLLDVGEQAP
jgi:hypothetical protein